MLVARAKSAYRKFLLGLRVFQNCLSICLQLIYEKEKTDHKQQDVWIMIFLPQKQTVVIKGGQYFSIESCEYFYQPGRLKNNKIKRTSLAYVAGGIRERVIFGGGAAILLPRRLRPRGNSRAAKLRVRFSSTLHQFPRGIAARVHGFAPRTSSIKQITRHGAFHCGRSSLINWAAILQMIAFDSKYSPICVVSEWNASGSGAANTAPRILSKGGALFWRPPNLPWEREETIFNN